MKTLEAVKILETLEDFGNIEQYWAKRPGRGPAFSRVSASVATVAKLKWSALGVLDLFLSSRPILGHLVKRSTDPSCKSLSYSRSLDSWIIVGYVLVGAIIGTWRPWSICCPVTPYTVKPLGEEEIAGSSSLHMLLTTDLCVPQLLVLAG